MEEALRHYQEALAIHREVGNRRAEGLVLGDLGALHAQQGRMEEARAALSAGEALLRAVDDRFDLGKLLCQRGECERLAGDLPAARAHLAEAESIARELAAGPDSEIGREIATLRADLDGASDVPNE